MVLENAYPFLLELCVVLRHKRKVEAVHTYKQLAQYGFCCPIIPPMGYPKPLKIAVTLKTPDELHHQVFVCVCRQKVMYSLYFTS